LPGKGRTAVSLNDVERTASLMGLMDHAAELYQVAVQASSRGPLQSSSPEAGGARKGEQSPAPVFQVSDSPEKAELLLGLQGLTEGSAQRGTAFLDGVGETDVSPVLARQGPLLYSLYTSVGPDAAQAYDSLRGNLDVIAKRWEGRFEGVLLRRALSDASRLSTPDERLPVLWAGLFAADQLIAEPAPVSPRTMADAILKGAGRTSVLIQSHVIQGALNLTEPALAEVSSLTLAWLREAVSQSQEVGPVLQGLVPAGDPRAPPSVRWTRDAVERGVVQHWLSNGKLPDPEQVRGLEEMPALPWTMALAPALTRTFEVPREQVPALRWNHHGLGLANTCYLAVAGAGLVHARLPIVRQLVDAGLGAPPGSFKFSLYLRDGAGRLRQREVVVTNRLFVSARTGLPLFSGTRSNAPESRAAGFWLAFLEKALALHRTSGASGYGAAEWGDPAEAFDMLLGPGVGKYEDIELGASATALLKRLQELDAAGAPITLTSRPDPNALRGSPVSHQHAYLFLGLTSIGGRPHVKLANLRFIPPRGTDASPLSPLHSLALKPFQPTDPAGDRTQEAFGEFTLPIEDAVRCFRRFDYADPSKLPS
jgi:hypothetical protein